jgi:hypothetical protein
MFSRKFQMDRVRFYHSQDRLLYRAFIALGSNMGDKVAMIEQACTEMEATGEVRILRTSSLYETRAMYVLDQDNFVNGACEVNYINFSRRNSLRSVDSNFIATIEAPRFPPVS